MKFLSNILTVILLLSSTVFADEKSNYEILGNKRISDQTILSIIEFKKNKNYKIDDLNNFQKKLYNTNTTSPASQDYYLDQTLSYLKGQKNINAFTIYAKNIPILFLEVTISIYSYVYLDVSA